MSDFPFEPTAKRRERNEKLISARIAEAQERANAARAARGDSIPIRNLAQSSVTVGMPEERHAPSALSVSISNVDHSARLESNLKAESELLAISRSRPQSARNRLIASGDSHLLVMLQTPSIRTDKVKSAKLRIADGSLDTDARLSIAADRLLDDLNK